MKYFALLLLVGPLMWFPFYADAADVLQRNPFERLKVPSVSQPAVGAPSTSKAEEVVLELRATLVSGSERLANVNGQILGLGETVLGYRLLRVEEGEAVLAKNGKEVLITMQREK